MDIKRIASVAFAALLLAACADYQNRPKQAGGTLIGAGLGALAGAFIGSEIGKSLDKADRLYAQQAQQNAHVAPIGETIAWNNPKSGNSGTFTPTRDGTDRATGEYCREYQTTINVGGKTESAYGTACRQPDGSWRII